MNMTLLISNYIKIKEKDKKHEKWHFLIRFECFLPVFQCSLKWIQTTFNVHSNYIKLHFNIH
jgi:hypothetical protein